MSAPHPLQRLVDQGSGRILVLHDEHCAALAGSLDGSSLSRFDTRSLATLERQRWRLVVLAVVDEAALRRTVSVLPAIGKATAVACWLDAAAAPVLVTPRPEWPAVVALNARRTDSGAALTVVRLSEPHLANGVLEQLARAAGPRTVAGSRGLVVATTRADPALAPPADPGFLVLASAAAGSDQELDVPPDVVITDAGGPPLDAHHVTGRAAALVSGRDLAGAPVDEGVLNPRGYLREPQRGLVHLVTRPDGLLEVTELAVVLDPVRGATKELVATLRDHIGLQVRWPDEAPAATARVVAGLATAGVPLLSDPVPDAATELLGPRLRAVLTGPTDLELPLLRDERSVLLRRAGLLEHSTLAWRTRLASAASLPFATLPACSIVVATRRPEHLEHLLRQVAKQRGSEVELVLAGHGFEPDPSVVRHFLGDRATVLAMPATTQFGQVLDTALRATSADLVVKMDDDDWYGPDFVTDLLLARHYSGADLVGMAAEYFYLEQLHRTIRRTDDAERAATYVAGGTILAERALLREVGGFRPVHRFVDAQLLAGARSMGAAIYRTHGLGYLYRRAASGHTWDPGLDFFLDDRRVAEQWDGFTPSRLLEHGADEVPHPAVG